MSQSFCLNSLGAATDVTVCRIVVPVGGVIKRVRLVASGATNTVAGTDYWDFHLRNVTNSANVASFSTWVAGAANDLVANTPVDLAFASDKSIKNVEGGDVIALFCDATGSPTNLAAVELSIQVEMV